jgi:hypothetical protein
VTSGFVLPDWLHELAATDPVINGVVEMARASEWGQDRLMREIIQAQSTAHKDLMNRFVEHIKMAPSMLILGSKEDLGI